MITTERREQILDKIIEEYINSAQPVSSQLLEKKYDFGICPATIRIEMQKLTDAGFLFQPHTSAGRVPTDKGYRFFVDRLLREKVFDSEDTFSEDVLGVRDLLKKEGEDIFRFTAQLAKFLATTSSNFTILHLLEKKFFWREGWEEILREPEFEERNFISNFTKFLENFEKNIGNLKINSSVKIYIGRENPFPKARDFSIICSKCHFPDDEVVVSFLGPKRMAYDRNISLINSLTKLLEKL